MHAEMGLMKSKSDLETQQSSTVFFISTTNLLYLLRGWVNLDASLDYLSEDFEGLIPGVLLLYLCRVWSVKLDAESKQRLWTTADRVKADLLSAPINFITASLTLRHDKLERFVTGKYFRV
jgi:hypothetical protein